MPLPNSKRKKIIKYEDKRLKIVISFITVLLFLGAVLLFIRGFIASNIFVPTVSVTDYIPPQPDANTITVPSDITIPDLSQIQSFGSNLQSSFIANTSKFALFVTNGNETSKIYKLGNDKIKTLFVTDHPIQNPRVYDTGSISYIRSTEESNDLILFDDATQSLGVIYTSEKGLILQSHYYDIQTDRFFIIEVDEFKIPILSYISSTKEKVRLARTDQIPVASELLYIASDAIFIKSMDTCYDFSTSEQTATRVDCWTIPVNAKGLVARQSALGLEIYSTVTQNSRQLDINTVSFAVKTVFTINNSVLYLAEHKFDEGNSYIGTYNVLNDAQELLVNLPPEPISEIFVVDYQLYAKARTSVFLYTKKIFQTDQPVLPSDGTWIKIPLDSPAVDMELLNQRDQ